MGIEVELSQNILASSQVVWDLLEKPVSWKNWWPDCIEAFTVDHKPLREGSQLEMVLQPKQRKTTFRPTVDMLTECKTLSLTHRSSTVQTTAIWYLQPNKNGCQVKTQVVYEGIESILLRLMGQKELIRFSLHSNLRGLKRYAERMA